MKRTTLAALLLTLFPMICHAGVGDLGALGEAVFTVFLVVWIALTLVVFLFVCRRLSIGKRLGCALLFLVSPVLWVALAIFKGYAFGEGYTEVTKTTDAPLVVASATFPPGSHAHYEQKGGFFGWRAQRTLLDIQSPQPILLGNIRISGLMLDQYSDQIRLTLSADQVIDGWPCAAAAEAEIYVTPKGPTLLSCWLTAAHTWHGQVVPAGAYLSRNGTDDWTFTQ